MSRDFHSPAAFTVSVRGGREKELAEIDLRSRSRARGGGGARFTAGGVNPVTARGVGRGCEPANRPERDPRDHAGG